MDSDDFYTKETSLQFLCNIAVAGNMSEFYDDSNINLPPIFKNNLDTIDIDTCGMSYYFTRFIFKRAIMEKLSIKFPLSRRYEDPVFFRINVKY